MNDENELMDVEDVGEAARTGRVIRNARSYRIDVGDESLNYRTAMLTDPVPLGRQILASAGLNPSDGYSLFAVLGSGDFEDVRLDEPFDLRGAGAEKFIAFRTDREFKFTLNDKELQWGKAIISGRVLHKLSGAGSDQVVFLEVRGGEDRQVEPNTLVDLALPGVERFFTASKPVPRFVIVVNATEAIDRRQARRDGGSPSSTSAWALSLPMVRSGESCV